MRRPSSFELKINGASKKPLATVFNRRSFFAAVAVVAVLTVLFSLFTLSLGAVEEIDTTGQGIGFSSVLYDSNNGLPTSEANAVVQSDNGMIWIGGYSGLTRYDGNSFYHYPASTGISSVVCLFCDSKGKLWIGTNDSGAATLEDNVFAFYTKADGLQSSSVRSITEDEAGNIIIATTMGLAYVGASDGKLHVIDDERINREYICELKKSGKCIYGVTLSGSFFTVKGLAVTDVYTSKEIGGDIINTVFPDPENEGYVYIGMQSDKIVYGKPDKGLFKKEKTLSCAPQHTVNDIKYVDGQLWICSDNGIGYFFKGNYTQILDVPMSNSVDKMMIDYEENLWFCSSRQGVMKICQNRFIDVFKLANLQPAVVNSTCTHNGLLYIGTDTGLIIVDKEYSRVENELTRLLSSVRIRCITSDSKGRLWFCTYSGDAGLICYNPENSRINSFTEENGLASNRVRMVKELSDGTLAVATNAGINIIGDGRITATYNNADGVSNLEILCIEEGDDGTVYLGSDGDGIYAVKDGKVTKLGLEDGLRSEVILRLKRNPADSVIWIITSNSIAFLKDGKITAVKNFPYSNNYDVYFDNDGCLWVLSSNGIYIVKLEEMLKNEAIDFTLYDISSGLPSVATVNAYSWLDDTGKLYIACVSGVSLIDIEHGRDSNTAIKLAVPFVMADEKYIAVHNGEEVRIFSDCKRLNIYANAFTYSLKNPRISYYLEGFENEPIVTTKRDMQYASYTNLKGGTYRFHLSLVDENTGLEYDSITVTIIKEKALYEQTWFILLMMLVSVLAVALIIALYFKKKTAKLVRKQEENRKLINEMTSAFAKCIDMKDRYTNGHSFRVAKYTAMLAEKLGKSKEEIEKIYNIALLHDIGKISIPDSILNKPGRLDDDEFAIMKNHSRCGNDILKEITIAPDLALGAGFHHERIDGRGYPSGLKGDEIPEVAQIIAVADTFDAMYSTRPYRKKMELGVVAEEIKNSAGTQLSEKVVEAFVQLYEEGAFNGEEEENSEQ